MTGLDNSQQVTDEEVLKAGGEQPPKPVQPKPDAADEAKQKSAQGATPR